jgi:anhydro-N-acetylmuramic acid kinase
MHHYLGLMSGTSVDGIDAVLVELSEPHGFRLLATHRHPIPTAVRLAIQELMQPGSNELDREGELDVALGRLFAEAATAVLTAAGHPASHVRAIGSHGQTVRHRPHTVHPFTRQLGNPSVIAELTGITTVADFRMRDMAAGGEGAPLVPAFHDWLFRAPGVSRAIVNIGGIANATWLPGDGQLPVIGFDTGPGNTLLDQWVGRHRGEPCDHDGAWGAGGQVLDRLLERLLAEDYFGRPPPKSTGRELFHLGWLDGQLQGDESPVDVQATLAELTARSIATGIRTLPTPVQEIYLCGGGAHNRDLVSRLGRQLEGVAITTTAALGLDPDWVEAAAFAWLAHRTLAGKPGNLPAVTGARREVVLGGIYLG